MGPPTSGCSSDTQGPVVTLTKPLPSSVYPPRELSCPFLRVGMSGRSARLDLLATKIELLQRAMLGPFLVEPMDSILRLDPESLQGQKHGPHRDDRRRSWPDVTAVEAPDPRSLDSARDDDLLDHRLEPVP
jgi:hypothetical protein